MLSGELPQSLKRQSGGSFVARSFFWVLAGLLIVDLIVFLCFRPGLWQWILLAGAEGIFLLLFAWRSSRAMRRLLAPLELLTAAVESGKDSALSAAELRRLTQKLEKVDAQSLERRVTILGGGRELTELGKTINEMLERIDERYQAQVRFTSDASHELRTPIAVIQGYADMLDRWGKEDPEIRQEAIDAIRQEAASMGELVEQLLFLVRGDNETQKVTMADVDLTALVTAVARETDLVDDLHQITTEIQTGVTAVADASMIKECLRVLCDNALKYTPEGGTISIGLKAENGIAGISVADTGIGIPEEDLPHVFDRFFRSDLSRSRATGGTGLGLAIAAWIAASHGGHIDVTSQPGVGSCFTLVIPLAPIDPDSNEDS